GIAISLGTTLGVYRSADKGESWAPVTGRKPAVVAPGKKKGQVHRTVAQTPAASRTTAPAPRNTQGAAPQPAAATIKRAQEALEKAGYEIGTPDGQMGPRTVAMLKRFQ